MSASERLAALDEAMTAGPWAFDGIHTIGAPDFPGNKEIAIVNGFHHRRMTNAAAIAALRNALPALQALVAAVELEHRWPDHLSSCPGCRALATLDERLPSEEK